MPRRLPAAFENLVVLRRNQRFSAYKGTFDGHRVFIKQAMTPALRNSIRAELWGLRSFDELALAGALPFNVPRILASGEDYLATTWAPGAPMRISPTSSSVESDIDFLSTIYAAIDKATRFSTGIRSGFALPNERGIDEADRLTKALATIPYADHVDPHIIASALSRLRDDIELPIARLTHADLTPQHVLRTPSGKTTVIDFDSCSLLWPRFYDVVNFAYNAAVHDVGFIPYSQRLLQQFFDKIGEPLTRHRKTLNVIAIVRGLSSIYEHLSKPNNLHNTTDELNDDRVAFIERSLALSVRGRYFLSP